MWSKASVGLSRTNIYAKERPHWLTGVIPTNVAPNEAFEPVFSSVARAFSLVLLSPTPPVSQARSMPLVVPQAGREGSLDAGRDVRHGVLTVKPTGVYGKKTMVYFMPLDVDPTYCFEPRHQYAVERQLADYLDTIFAVIVARRTDGAVAFDADATSRRPWWGRSGACWCTATPRDAAKRPRTSPAQWCGDADKLSIIMRKHHQ